MSPHTSATNDLSSLLFSTGERSSTPIIGPVEISRVGVVHLRGLVATRDISPGECLFVVDPSASAPALEVWNRWEKSDGGRSIESFAEDVLLEDMRRCLDSDAGAAASFMALFGEDGGKGESSSSSSSSGAFQDNSSLMDLLLGRGTLEGNVGVTDKKALLGIVRRNAFGPDYRNYAAIEEEWSTKKGTGECPPVSRRLLGMYPLSAIINHSCEPNAVRVFAGETMLVHSSASICKGQEILWSYIPPSQTYGQRQSQILSKYGFRCACARCQNESSALESVEGLAEQLASMDELNLQYTMGKGATKMEEILKDKRLSNETRRYLRVGYTNLYINHFNSTLLELGEIAPPNANAIREKVLLLATQLHFAFAACHNASTEHLSVLHLCYELISFIHASSDDQNKTIVKVRFWTEQVKKAHMVRYGSLGNDLEKVRQVMKHTRLVLRNRNGLLSAQWNFI